MKGKFIGETKGNRDLHCNRSTGGGGRGESHKGGAGLGGKFAGGTKGNRDLPINRTEGHKMGAGDPLGAGGS